MSRDWPDRDLEVLDRKFPDTRTADIANELGRSFTAIRRMARRRGLEKTPEYVQMVRATAASKASRADRAARVVREEPDDPGRKVFVLPPEGPGYGPRIVHRISAA